MAEKAESEPELPTADPSPQNDADSSDGESEEISDESSSDLDENLIKAVDEDDEEEIDLSEKLDNVKVLTKTICIEIDMEDAADFSLLDFTHETKDQQSEVFHKFEEVKIKALKKKLKDEYDVTDDWIDDSTPMDLDLESKTRIGGFFINEGTIELKDGGTSSDDSPDYAKTRKNTRTVMTKGTTIRKESKKPKTKRKSSKKETEPDNKTDESMENDDEDGDGEETIKQEDVDKSGVPGKRLTLAELKALSDKKNQSKKVSGKISTTAKLSVKSGAKKRAKTKQNNNTSKRKKEDNEEDEDSSNSSDSSSGSGSSSGSSSDDDSSNSDDSSGDSDDDGESDSSDSSEDENEEENKKGKNEKNEKKDKKKKIKSEIKKEKTIIASPIGKKKKLNSSSKTLIQLNKKSKKTSAVTTKGSGKATLKLASSAPAPKKAKPRLPREEMDLLMDLPEEVREHIIELSVVTKGIAKTKKAKIHSVQMPYILKALDVSRAIDPTVLTVAINHVCRLTGVARNTIRRRENIYRKERVLDEQLEEFKLLLAAASKSQEKEFPWTDAEKKMFKNLCENKIAILRLKNVSNRYVNMRSYFMDTILVAFKSFGLDVKLEDLEKYSEIPVEDVDAKKLELSTTM